MRNFAAYCVKGHLVGSKEIPRSWSGLRSFLEADSEGKQWFSSYCTECGSLVAEKCLQCATRFPKNAKYCGSCGKPFPWTEAALAAAKDYTDELDLSQEDKAILKATFEDLTTESPRTPLAISRFQRITEKLGPIAKGVLDKILETTISEGIKKLISGGF